MSAGDLVRTAIESLNSNIDYFYEQLAEDAPYEPLGLVGPVAIRRVDQAFYDLFTTHHRVVERLIEDRDRVYVWVRFMGTTRAGTRVEAESNNHYVVSDGKIASMTIFADTDALRADLPGSG